MPNTRRSGSLGEEKQPLLRSPPRSPGSALVANAVYEDTRGHFDSNTSETGWRNIVASDVGVENDEREELTSPASPLPPLDKPTHVLSIKSLIFVLLYFGIVVAVYVPTADQWNGDKTDPVLDAVYFAVVTLTTVGYGDITPRSSGTRLFVSMFVWVTIGVIAIILGEAAGWVLRRQVQLELKMMHIRKHSICTPAEAYTAWSFEHRIRAGTALCGVFLCLASGTALFYFYETDHNFVDAFYGASMSITTVGYGDMRFRTLEGRALCTVWLLLSSAVTATAVAVLASYRAEKWHYETVQYRIERALAAEDIDKADIDGDGIVQEGEFVVFKLIETGMVDSNFVDTLRMRYRQLGQAEVSRRYSETIVRACRLNSCGGRGDDGGKIGCEDAEEEEPWELDTPTPTVSQERKFQLSAKPSSLGTPANQTTLRSVIV